MQENILSGRIIGCCITVHRLLGPGLLESAYEEALAYELGRQNLKCTRQRSIRVRYRDIELSIGFRADVIVDDRVLTYLKLSDLKLGLLVNFNTALIKDGIRRIVNDL